MQPGVAYVGGLLWLPRERFDLNVLRGSLTFVANVDKNQKGKPKVIRAWADKPHHIGVPLYTFGDLHSQEFRSIFQDLGVPLRDLRPKSWETIDVQSKVVLDAISGSDVQRRASAALARSEAGILVLGCGKGKTVISLHSAAQFRSPFIIVVDNKGLAEQWLCEINRYLTTSTGRPPEVGIVGDGRREWDRPIVIAIINTLSDLSGSLPMDIRRRFAISIWDECAILGAPHFGRSAPLFLGRRWGLSATPQRADGLERLYYLHIGRPIMVDLIQDLKPDFFFYRVKHRIDTNDPTYRSYVAPHGQTDVSALFTYLAGVRERTEEIALLIRRGMQAGRKILVLSRRLFLLDQLAELIPEAGVIRGSVRGALRVSRVKNSDVLLCQMRLGERALDKPELDMLIVTEPIRRDAVFQQIIGRVQRYREGKPTPIVVFVEDEIGVCKSMCRTLKKYIRTWPAEKGGPFDWRYTGESGGGGPHEP